jgi:hypothetical protein
MAVHPHKDWERDSDKLFIHESGIRIQRMAYKGKEGWFLIPTDLDQAVLEFEPTPEGRDKAFESFAKGVLVVKPKRAKPPSTKKAPTKSPPAATEAEDADEDDDEEKEESDQGDEG